MRTSEDECLDALREAAEVLGESPTKRQYEELGVTPAASTILRVVGGWNEAKEKAGLETAPSRGSRVQPKPEDVELPDGMEWNELSQDQRWHYKNVEKNTERTLRRRARLRAWLNDRKAERGCIQCGESDPACLDFHHPEDVDKEMDVTELVTHGYSKASLREEIEKCDVRCANCHRKAHHEPPASSAADEESLTKRQRLRRWSLERRRAEGCRRCGEDDSACLLFHHVDPSEKVETIAKMTADGYAKREIRAEIAKCVVLCANCHRRDHFEPPMASFSDDD